jgi:MFS family permease
MARIAEEIADYMDRMKSFSRNSKMFLFSHALTTVGMGVFSVIFNLYILELGFSASFLGLIISSHLVFSALFLFPGGIICDKIGRRNTLLISTLLKCTAIIVLCSVEDRYLLLLANSARGMGNSLTTVSIDPFMMEQSNHYERMHLFSVNAALRSFSRMVGSLLGGFLPALFAFTVIGLTIQYQYTLLTAALFNLAAFFPLFFIKEEKTFFNPAESSRKLFSGKRTFLIQYAFCNIIIGFGAGVIVPFFNVYFSQELHASAAEIGLIFSISELSMGVASLVLPFVVRKFNRVGSTVLTQALSIPFLLLIMVATRLVYAFLGFFMRMTLMNMAHPAQRNFYMDEIAEQERGKANSISNFGSTISRAAGSDIGGYLIATGNFSYAFQLTAVIYVMGTVLFYFFFRKKE